MLANLRGYGSAATRTDSGLAAHPPLKTGDFLRRDSTTLQTEQYALMISLRARK